MSISLSEAIKLLLSGKALDWSKFDKQKGGTITLGEPGQRRLLDYLLNQNSSQVALADEGLFDGLVEAWGNVDFDPVSNIAETEQTIFDSCWRLSRIETSGFGGLNSFGGHNFDLEVNRDNWCIEGRNSSGKTSLVSAIIWALTGQRIREQEGLVFEDGQRAPVADESGKQIGHWPTFAVYPDEKKDLASDAEVWVRLTFRDDGENEAIAFRKITSSAAGDIEQEELIDPNIQAAIKYIEMGLLMPARLSTIGFGARSQSLYQAVKLLTGLDQLADIAEGTAIFGHKGRRFLRYAKDKGIERIENSFASLLESAREQQDRVDIDIAKFKSIDQKNLCDDLRETAANASKRAVQSLQSLESAISETLDTSDVSDRKTIREAVSSARHILNEGTKGVPLFITWAALKDAYDDPKIKELPSLLLTCRDSLEQAIHWHRRQDEDSKLRFKAIASQFFEIPEEGNLAECPLCISELENENQRQLATELERLKSDSEAAQRHLSDVCANIEKTIRDQLTDEIKQDLDSLSSMEPASAYAEAVLSRFVLEPPFSDALTGVAAEIKGLVEDQEKALPLFSFEPGEPESETDLDIVSDTYKFIISMERLVSIIEWWHQNREPFVVAWSQLVGIKIEGEDNRNICSIISSLETTLEEASPLEIIADSLSQAAKEAEEWLQISEVQKVREKIAEALEPLKDLKNLVAAETASSIASLSGRIKEILDEIYLRERLSFEQASLGKKVVQVDGSFATGMKIDASLVANTSWLRAILWCFIISLREKNLDGESVNAFPLMVLDDPQATFDPRNERKWAELLAGIANEDFKKKESAQLIITTHQHLFFQILTDHAQFKAQKGQIAGVSSGLSPASIVNGGHLERIYRNADQENDDELGYRYISDLRVYCEELLKYMLKAEGPSIGGLALKALTSKLEENKGKPPFDRPTFKRLVHALIDLNPPMISLVQKSHHSFDGTIGLAQANDVREFWLSKLQPKLQEAFSVFADYETYLGEPRLFTWSNTVTEFPATMKEDVASCQMFKTGTAAAAKTDGRVGDGVLTIEEWQNATPVNLPNHEIYLLNVGTLEPVATIGDSLIVSNYEKVNPRNLVVASYDGKLLARRYNESDAHIEIAVLTGQHSDPYNLPQPEIVPREKIKPKKIVGTLFTSKIYKPSSALDSHEIQGVADTSVFKSALDSSRLLEVEGRSAEPIALDGQYLITHAIDLNTQSVSDLNGDLVIAVTESGEKYFKRLRCHDSIAVLESVNPDGENQSELVRLCDDEVLGLPRLASLLSVTGVLFELPNSN